MIQAAASNPRAGEPPKHQQHQPPPAPAIPVALHAQHQHAPPALMSWGVTGGAAATWTAAQHEEWLRAMAHPPSMAGVPGRGVSASMPAAAVASSADRAPPRVSHTHDKEQTLRKETGRPNRTTRQEGQMGCGALSNAIGAWTSAGIFVSSSRAGRIDESVDVGAQANPSGVYPVMQPIAYLPRPQRPPGIPSHGFRESSDSQRQQHAARVAASVNPRPQQAHPAIGQGMPHQHLHLPHEVMFSRPVSAPAGSFFSPGAGTFKRPPPPSPGAGPRRASATPPRGKAGSAVAGGGSSKAAMRAAARAAAAASVISAMADSRKTEARVAAAAAASEAAAAAGAAEAAVSTEPETRNSGTVHAGRTKRERTGLRTGGGNQAEGQPRRPATAPASSAAAMATAKYTQPHPDPFSFPQTSAESYQVGPWNAGVSVIMPMPLPSEWHDQWARGQARVDALPTSTPPQPPPRRPSDGLALNTVTTAATPAAVMAKEEPHAEGLTAKSARTSPVPRATPSPEGEDTYTDSWLAGMLWASSSSPDVEGLEVELPVAPAPLDALRSDDRGTRDDEDVGGGEAILFMEPQSTSHLQVAGDSGAGAVRLALGTIGAQNSALPFPRGGGSQLAERTVNTQVKADPDPDPDALKKDMCRASVNRTPAVVISGEDAGTHGDLQTPSRQFRQGAATKSAGVCGGVRDTGCSSGNTNTAVVRKLSTMVVASLSSPQRATRDTSDITLAPAVKGSDSPPRPSASSSPVAAAAAAAAAAEAAAAAAAATPAATTTPASAAAAPPTTTASAPERLRLPHHRTIPPPPSVLSPCSLMVADPTLQQPLPATAATSLPDWAHHPPPLPGLDVTSLASNPEVHSWHGPSASARPNDTENTGVVAETVAAGQATKTAAAARRAPRPRNQERVDESAGAGRSHGAVANSTVSACRRALEASTAAAAQASAAAGSRTARVTSPATAAREEKTTTKAPRAAESACTAASRTGIDGGCPKPAECGLPNTERSRSVASTSAVSAGSRGGSSPRGRKRPNNVETGIAQQWMPCRGHRPTDEMAEMKAGGGRALDEISEPRKSSSRGCTQQQHDGMAQLGEAGSMALGADGRSNDEGRGGGEGATATRRSKRRRSSGNLLQ